jgi:flagellar biosynthesis component FlhA
MIGIVLLVIVIALAFGASSILNGSVKGSEAAATSTFESSTRKPVFGQESLNRIVLLIVSAVLLIVVFRVVPIFTVGRIALYIIILLAPFWAVNRLVAGKAPTSNHNSQRRKQTSQQSSQERTQTRPKTRRSYKTPYQILEVPPTASRAEITKAYRKMAKLYHPDRVAELAPEFRDLAEERMKQINAAYEKLSRN